MKLTDKQFWIWEIALTLVLSAMPLIMYGENIKTIMLIVASYTLAAAIGLISSSKVSTFATWLLIFCTANGVYIIDLIVIDTLRLIKMESYPLIIGQVYLLPVCVIANMVISIVGGAFLAKHQKT